MDSHWGTPNHRKRKRRRGPSKPALPAQLFFDSRLKGDVGLLSEDLFNELFPQRVSSSGKSSKLFEQRSRLTLPNEQNLSWTCPLPISPSHQMYQLPISAQEQPHGPSYPLRDLPNSMLQSRQLARRCIFPPLRRVYKVSSAPCRNLRQTSL